MGALALRTLEEFAPDAETLASALGLSSGLAAVVRARVVEKLRREPVEDYRIDFEDGYGSRPDAEEDGHAVSAARESGDRARRGDACRLHRHPHQAVLAESSPRGRIRTLDLFVTALAARRRGQLPDHFVVTLPKVTSPEQVDSPGGDPRAAGEALSCRGGSLRLEIMVETPQAIVGPDGASRPCRSLAAAPRPLRRRRISGPTTTRPLCNVTAAQQSMRHPACDFARQVMQASLAGTGVWLSDGATSVLPVPPHRPGRADAHASAS